MVFHGLLMSLMGYFSSVHTTSSTRHFHWSTCTIEGKWAAKYVCITGFYDFFIDFWDCCVVFSVFLFFFQCYKHFYMYFSWALYRTHNLSCERTELYIFRCISNTIRSPTSQWTLVCPNVYLLYYICLFIEQMFRFVFCFCLISCRIDRKLINQLLRHNRKERFHFL